MATLYFREYKELHFLTKVVDGDIVLTLHEDSASESESTKAAPERVIDAREVVQDNVLYVGPTEAEPVTSVNIRVLDDGLLKMEVSSPTLWTRQPVSGTAIRSEYDAPIPSTEGERTLVTMLIEAKNSTGGVVARRSQTVIIKHRVGV